MENPTAYTILSHGEVLTNEFSTDRSDLSWADGELGLEVVPLYRGGNSDSVPDIRVEQFAFVIKTSAGAYWNCDAREGDSFFWPKDTPYLIEATMWRTRDLAEEYVGKILGAEAVVIVPVRLTDLG